MKALRITSIVMSVLALIGCGVVLGCATPGKTHKVTFPTEEHNEEVLVCLNSPEKNEMECISFGLFQAAARQKKGEQDFHENFNEL